MRHQALATYLFATEGLAFEHPHKMTPMRQTKRRATAGKSAANHHHFGLLRHRTSDVLSHTGNGLENSMPATLVFTDHLDTTAPRLVVVGRREQLLSDSVRGLLPTSLSANIWSNMVKSLSPGDHGRSTTTWVESPDVSVVAAVLPEVKSRHNSPSRAWSIPGLVRAAATKGDCDIVLAVSETSHAFAASCAAARAFSLYKDVSHASDRTVRVMVQGPAGPVTEFAPLQIAANGVRKAAAWVDKPPSVLGVDAFVAAAEAVADAHDAVKITVFRNQSLTDEGLGGIHGVGKAANQAPAMVVLDYVPAQDLPDGPVWVGKGIVYDTGGLSIKGKTGMPGMKSDMGGAAAVLGAFDAAAHRGYEGRLTAILCMAENAVGPDSVRPDDILHMYSGKTVEINNTDAEGRLVLSDGVAWAAKNRSPTQIIDLATLTGAQLVSTGKLIAALFCNDEDLEQKTVALGRETGELCHAMPYAPELHRKEFASTIADMRNSVKDRGNAQVSCAGQFIGNHLAATDYTGPWLHIDMAGPSTSAGRGTGYGVALLLGLLGLHR